MGAGDIRAGGAVVEISGDERGLQASLGRAAAKLESFEKNIKSKFGGRSLLADAFDIAVGGGAVAGITMATQAIGAAADKVAALNAEFANGQLSVSEYAGEIARSIPVLGEMVTMWDKVIGALTGQAEATAKAEAENASFKKSQDSYNAALAETKKLLEEMNPNKSVGSLDRIDAEIKQQKQDQAQGWQGRVKDLQNQRAKLAGREMEKITNPMTIANDQANKERQAAVDAGRLNRNAIIEDVQRTRSRLQKQVEGDALGVLQDAGIDQIAGFDGAAEVERQRAEADRQRQVKIADYSSRLDMVNRELAANTPGKGTNFNPALIGGTGTDDPVVAELAKTRDAIVSALEDLVAD